MEGDLSDGELCEDLSDISSDLDFFESLKKKLESSKHQHQGEILKNFLLYFLLLYNNY